MIWAKRVQRHLGVRRQRRRHQPANQNGVEVIRGGDIEHRWETTGSKTLLAHANGFDMRQRLFDRLQRRLAAFGGVMPLRLRTATGRQ